MPKRRAPPPIPHLQIDSLRFVRWLLLLLSATEAAGLGPVSRQRLHTLLFVSFASSRFYGLAPLRLRAKRTEQGPYYRAAHHALGILVLSGLVELEKFRPHASQKDLQFEGEMQLRRRGFRVAHTLRRTRHGEKLYQFLLELCLGSVQVERSVLDRALSLDLTYQAAETRNDATVGVEPEGRSPTVEGLNTISRYLNSFTTAHRRDALAAYQQLLEHRAAA